MFNEFLKKTQELHQNREPFAIAFVVNRQVPSSGKPGDKAVIEKNGRITGWIGGGCTRGIVLKEAAQAIKDGKPRVVRISPDVDSEPKPGVMDYKMTCHSGGAVELYIEPILPRPEILIMGKSQVAMALHRLAKAMDYTVTIATKGADLVHFPQADRILETGLPENSAGPNTCVVVCTQGEDDEGHLQQALRSGADYVSFVASRRKANAIFQTLRSFGLTFDDLKKVKTPAGLDINAKLPEEVAVSILAEIVAFIRDEDRQKEAAQKDTDEEKGASDGNAAFFINPVCDVPVEKSTAKHVIEYKGINYYFCCDGCKVSFEKDPEKYALAEQ
jgi:xanthine dehydrogenase accessory factor